MRAYGTNVVGGVTPGKGGQSVERFAGVQHGQRERVAETGATHSVIFVPPPFAADALFEVSRCRHPLLICITEGIPVHDMLKVVSAIAAVGMRIIGPNCPGIISPGEVARSASCRVTSSSAGQRRLDLALAAR